MFVILWLKYLRKGEKMNLQYPSNKCVFRAIAPSSTYGKRIDFSDCRIFMIKGKELDKIFIGGTTLGLQKRLNGYLKAYRTSKKKGYKDNMSMFDIFYESERVSIYELEHLSCKDDKELKSKVKEWIKYYINLGYIVVNRNIRIDRPKNIVRFKENIKKRTFYISRTKYTNLCFDSLKKYRKEILNWYRNINSNQNG